MIYNNINPPLVNLTKLHIFKITFSWLLSFNLNLYRATINIFISLIICSINILVWVFFILFLYFLWHFMDSFFLFGLLNFWQPWYPLYYLNICSLSNFFCSFLNNFISLYRPLSPPIISTIYYAFSVITIWFLNLWLFGFPE